MLNLPRQAGFAVDWCAFRLISREKEGKTEEEEEEERDLEDRGFVFPQRGSTARESKVEGQVTAALLPLLIFVIFCGALGGLLWADCGQVGDVTVCWRAVCPPGEAAWRPLYRGFV